jgi:hypothetical protein
VQVRYGKRMPETTEGVIPLTAGGELGRSIPLEVGDGTVVTISGLPSAVGDMVLAAEPLRHGLGNAATSGIWRILGPAGSAILKVARLPAANQAPKAWPTSDDPAHWNYWRRESLAYESGLPATAYASTAFASTTHVSTTHAGTTHAGTIHAGTTHAGGGITAAALLETRARADGGVELWLADVGGTAGFDWTVPRLARFARELGVAQARWAGRVPDTPWLSRRWLAQYLAEGPGRMVAIEAADWDHPNLAAWPVRLKRRLKRLWDDRDRLVAAAEATERTLCHLDVWPANLVDDAGTSVLLDWAFTGDGAIGEDVANLIVDSFTDGLMDVAKLPELAESATDGYLAGLRDGGWSGSPDTVRTAIAVCGAAKYSWFGPVIAARAIRGTIGNASYGQDTSATSAARRLTPLVTMLATWSQAADA